MCVSVCMCMYVCMCVRVHTHACSCVYWETKVDSDVLFSWSSLIFGYCVSSCSWRELTLLTGWLASPRDPPVFTCPMPAQRPALLQVAFSHTFRRIKWGFSNARRSLATGLPPQPCYAPFLIHWQQPWAKRQTIPRTYVLETLDSFCNNTWIALVYLKLIESLKLVLCLTLVLHTLHFHQSFVTTLVNRERFSVIIALITHNITHNNITVLLYTYPV